MPATSFTVFDSSGNAITAVNSWLPALSYTSPLRSFPIISPYDSATILELPAEPIPRRLPARRRNVLAEIYYVH